MSATLGLPYLAWWGYTPRYLGLCAKAKKEEFTRYQELTAWHASLMMAMFTDDPPTVDMLMGRTKRVKIETFEQLQEAIAKQQPRQKTKEETR